MQNFFFDYGLSTLRIMIKHILTYTHNYISIKTPTFLKFYLLRQKG